MTIPWRHLDEAMERAVNPQGAPMTPDTLRAMKAEHERDELRARAARAEREDERYRRDATAEIVRQRRQIEALEAALAVAPPKEVNPMTLTPGPVKMPPIDPDTLPPKPENESSPMPWEGLGLPGEPTP